MRRLLLFALFVVFAGCSSSAQDPAPTTSTAGFTGTVWRWTGVTGGEPGRVDHPGRYTIEFLADGRYAVRADCNSGGGAWSGGESGLSMTGGPMTMAACGESSLDQRFLELLGQASAASRDGDRLAITAGAVTLNFEAMAEIDLAGTAWLIRAVNNGQGAVTSVIADTELTIAFGEDGQVSGSAGCNRFTGSFEVAGQTLGFSPLATTRRACMAEGVVEQEQNLLDALGTAASWEIRGERAQIRATDGALAVDMVSAVTGVAMVRVRRALPPEAVLTVQLLDVSRADVASKLVGEHSRTLDGAQSPFPFEVTFDPSEIDAPMSYSLRATISHEGELMFTTTQACPVLTRNGEQFGIEMQLEAAGD